MLALAPGLLRQTRSMSRLLHSIVSPPAPHALEAVVGGLCSVILMPPLQIGCDADIRNVDIVDWDVAHIFERGARGGL